jgi:hypothetical protein
MSRFLPKRRRGRSSPPGRPRRSVYEDRPAPEPEERWRYLGEIDPATGRSTVDLSKASGWRPIEELWRRR